jgi:hypothetical protein
MMVVKLNMILITSPELADFRRRLKNLESKVGISRPFGIPADEAGWPNALLLSVSVVVP